MNLWHEIPRGTIEELNVIIEIPRGSHNKYEFDKETGLIKLDRANYNASPYPCEYGFVPQSLWDDGDAVDILLLATYPIHPGVLVSVRPVAIMHMIDGGESDDKIICVPVDDMRWDDIKDLNDLNKHSLKEFQHFFETIKQLKGNPVEVTITGFEGKSAAQQAIQKSFDLYDKKYGK